MIQRPSAPATLRLDVAADPEWLSYIRHCIEGVTAHLDCPEEDALQIEMSVDEACANSIDAMRRLAISPNEARVCVKLWVEENQLHIQVQDCANSFFDAFQRAMPISDYTDRTQRRGYGLQIIKTFMDAVHYEHCSQNGNLLFMTKQFAHSTIQA